MSGIETLRPHGAARGGRSMLARRIVRFTRKDGGAGGLDMLIAKRFRRLAATMAGVWALATGGAAAADVLFTTGPSQGVNGASMGPGDHSYANIFTLDDAATLTGVMFGMSMRADAALLGIEWAILDRAQGDGGTVLYSGATTDFDQTTPVGTPYPPLMLRDVTFATPAAYLASGTYWLRLSVDSSTANPVYWDAVGSQAGSAELVYEGVSYARETRTAFTLYGTAGEVGVVPEPATWAMMLLGFGLAGGLLRRRRASVGAA